MLEESQSIALTYRIYYKCVRTNLNVHALVKSPKDKILLIQSSTNDVNFRTRKAIMWKDIELPTDWMSENESYPHTLQNDTTNLDYIHQYLDESVRISFNDIRISTPSRNSEDNRATSSNLSISRKDKELPIPSNLKNKLKLERIETSPQISKPRIFYTSSTLRSRRRG